MGPARAPVRGIGAARRGLICSEEISYPHPVPAQPCWVLGRGGGQGGRGTLGGRWRGRGGLLPHGGSPCHPIFLAGTDWPISSPNLAHGARRGSLRAVGGRVDGPTGVQNAVQSPVPPPPLPPRFPRRRPHRTALCLRGRPPDKQRGRARAPFSPGAGGGARGTMDGGGSWGARVLGAEPMRAIQVRGHPLAPSRRPEEERRGGSQGEEGWVLLRSSSFPPPEQRKAHLRAGEGPDHAPRTHPPTRLPSPPSFPPPSPSPHPLTRESPVRPSAGGAGGVQEAALGRADGAPGAEERPGHVGRDPSPVHLVRALLLGPGECRVGPGARRGRPPTTLTP